MLTASNAAVTDIAYTSFEAESTGSWSFTNTPASDNAAITGNKILNLSNSSLTKSGLNSSQTYIVSYWTKNTAAFTVSGTQAAPVQGRSSEFPEALFVLENPIVINQPFKLINKNHNFILNKIPSRYVSPFFASFLYTRHTENKY